MSLEELNVSRRMPPMRMAEGKQLPNQGLEALNSVAPEVVSRMGYQEGGMTPSNQDVQQLAEAVMGQSPNADAVINMFIEKYGNELFMQVREMILNPQGQAQTQGMIKGQGGGMDDEVMGMIWWQENFDISFINMDPATPDIIKYKGEKGVWTIDWMTFTGVNKESGDTVTGPLHTMNYVNEDGKIEMTVNYFDRESMGAQIQASFGMHRNGRVYDEHPLIDKINQMVTHFEAGEIAELTTYFTEDATFMRLSTMGETPLTLEERIETWNASVAENSKRDLVQFGYPDAVYYKRSDSWTVYSWWWANNTNAETGEVTKQFLHLVHNFNNEGKVTSEGVFLQQ